MKINVRIMADNNKPILAIETSNKICSVCLYFNDEKYSEVNHLNKYSHSKIILSLIDNVLKNCDTELRDLSYLAFSEGPGSFTGLRIGLSAVKSIAFANSLQVSMVPTFEAAALQIASFKKDGDHFAVATKVNNEEIYFQKFKKLADNYVVVKEIDIINKLNLLEHLEGDELFAEFDYDYKSRKKYFAPSSFFVAKWSAERGAKNLVNEIDFIEPNYLKEFIIRSKEKK